MLVLLISLSLLSGALSSVLCPVKLDPTITVNLPHPTNCGKYLACVGPQPVEMDCPLGLHWNEQASYCDYPRGANCSRENVPVERNFNSTAVSASVCLPQTNRCPLNSKPNEKVVFLKHQDCRKFYACVSTHPVELSCPSKLYWNSKSCVCDYEIDSDCDESDLERREEEQEPEPDSPAMGSEEQDNDQSMDFPDNEPDQEHQKPHQPDPDQTDQQPDQQQQEQNNEDENPEEQSNSDDESDADANEPEPDKPEDQPESDVDAEVRVRRSIQARQNNEEHEEGTTTAVPQVSGAVHAITSVGVLIATITISVL